MPIKYESKIDTWLNKLSDCVIDVVEVDVQNLYQDGSTININTEQEYGLMMKDLLSTPLVSVDFEHHTEDSFNGT